MLRRIFGSQPGKPGYFLSGIQIHIAACKKNAAKGGFAFIGAVIDDFPIFIAETAGKQIFVFGNDFRQSAVFLQKGNKPGERVRLEGIADQIVIPVLPQGIFQHLIISCENRLVDDEIGRL